MIMNQSKQFKKKLSNQLINYCEYVTNEEILPINAYVKRKKKMFKVEFTLKTFCDNDLNCEISKLSSTVINVRDASGFVVGYFVHDKDNNAMHLIENDMYIGSILKYNRSIYFLYCSQKYYINTTTLVWIKELKYIVRKSMKFYLKNKTPTKINNEYVLKFNQSGGIASRKNFKMVNIQNKVFYECLKQNHSLFDIFFTKPNNFFWGLGGVVAVCMI